MNLKVVGALLILTALAALGASCSQPPTQAASQAASQAQADTASSSHSAPAQTEAAPKLATEASLAGEYEGEFDGATAAVTISGSAPRYNVHIMVGSDGCAGGALGPAQVGGGGVLTMRPTDDASCTITMTPTSGGFSVQEHQCSNLHGDACSFSGELHHAH
jgi:hypothetical protein